MSDVFKPRSNAEKTTQSAQTPREFLNAVEARFGVHLGFDCACTTTDCVAWEMERTTVDADCKPDPNGAHWIDRRSLHGYFFDLGVDALKQDWTTIEQDASFENPPFHHMAPWAKKNMELAIARRAQLQAMASRALPFDTRLFTRKFCLYPAALGSSWFRTYVEKYARTYVLGPRLVFVDALTGEPFKLPLVDPNTGLQKLYKKGPLAGQPIFTDGAINRDCMLVDWGAEVPGIETWQWKEPKKRAKKVKEEPLVVD